MALDLVKAMDMSEDDILIRIKYEQDRGLNAMRGIYQNLNADYALYKSTKKKDKQTKIGDWTVFSTHSALMARSYITRPESEYLSNGMGEEDKIKNLNHAMKQDLNNDDIEIVKYWRDFHKYLFGVGIVTDYMWDGEKKTSKYNWIDPRNAVFDPDGDYAFGNYSSFGFFRYVSQNELIEDGLYDENLNNYDRDSIVVDQKEQDNRLAGVNTQFEGGESKEYNPTYKVYYHFTKFLNKKGEEKVALVITGNNSSLLLGTSILDYMPFAFSYWRPDGTPTGMRVTQITGDVQRIKAEIANLRLDKSKAELYPMYIRNTRLLPNASDLKFGFNKILDANPLEGESLNNALTPLQKDFRTDQSFRIDDDLDRNIESAVSIGKIAQGSSPERREGVGTNKLIAESTDVNLALNAKIEAWGEKQLLRLYLLGLRFNLKSGDIKTVNIQGAYGLIPVKLKKADFILDDTVTINIVTVIEKEEKQNKLRVAYGTAIGLIQNLGLSESAKKYLYRDYFETIGLDKEKAERIIDYTPQEIEAFMNVQILDSGIMVEVKDDYDPITHLSVLKSAKPSQNVDLYKYGLLQLYKIQGGQNTEGVQQGLEEEQSIANNLSAQAMSNVSNESKAMAGENV